MNAVASRPVPASIDDSSEPIAALSTVLSCGRAITGLVSLSGIELLDGGPRDVVCVATSSTVQAFDVREGMDVFFKDTNEPVATLASHCHAEEKNTSTSASAIVYTGGFSSISGYDSSGADVYWTTCDAAVKALAVADVDGDGACEVIAGRADGSIQVLRDTDVLAIASEGEAITCLVVAPVEVEGDREGRLIAFTTAGGAVGVYQLKKISGVLQLVRLWRSSARSRATVVAFYDIDSDGQTELVAGWASGRIEARRLRDGALLWRDTLPSAVASLVTADVRGDGRPLLCVGLTDGVVRGYAASDAATLAAVRAAFAQTSRSEADDEGREEAGAGEKYDRSPAEIAAEIARLTREKAALDAQLDKTSKEVAGAKARLRIQCRLVPNPATGACDLVVNLLPLSNLIANDSSSNNTVDDASIVAATVFCADPAVFGPGQGAITACMMSHHMSQWGVGGGSSGDLAVPLRPIANVTAQLRLSVMATISLASGGSGSVIFEASSQLPRFSSFMWRQPAELAAVAAGAAPVPFALPEGSVTFPIPNNPSLHGPPASRVGAWIASAFPVPPDAAAALLQHHFSTSGSSSVEGRPSSASASAIPAGLDVLFIDVRSGAPLRISVKPPPQPEQSASSSSSTAVISTDDMRAAGDVVTHLAAALQMSAVEPTAHFPAAMAAFADVITQLEEAQAVRAKLAADSASNATALKAMLLTAEDARIRADVRPMQRAYAELRGVTGMLVAEHLQRERATASLTTALKVTNAMITQAAALRGECDG